MLKKRKFLLLQGIRQLIPPSFESRQIIQSNLSFCSSDSSRMISPNSRVKALSGLPSNGPSSGSWTGSSTGSSTGFGAGFGPLLFFFGRPIFVSQEQGTKYDFKLEKLSLKYLFRSLVAPQSDRLFPIENCGCPRSNQPEFEPLFSPNTTFAHV